MNEIDQLKLENLALKEVIKYLELLVSPIRSDYDEEILKLVTQEGHGSLARLNPALQSEIKRVLPRVLKSN